MNTVRLKYLFTARFDDGTVIEQDEHDLSRLEASRSRFYDVVEYAKTSDLRSFSLTDGVDTYYLDLKDGHFEINGKWLTASDKDLPSHSDDPSRPLFFRLIYFRKNQVDFSQKELAEFQAGLRAERDITELAHRVFYFMGWQTTINGKNYRQMIGIK